jgi:hypothetical protein
MHYSKLNLSCYANGNSGASKTLDMGQSFQSITLTAACTLTFTAPPCAAAGALVVIQDATGGRVITWPAAAIGQKYVNLAANGVTILNWTFDGTNYHFRHATTPQAVNDVDDADPTLAQLTTAFGAPATLGRGFIGTIDDNDDNTVSYLVWSTDGSYFYKKGTKAT